MPTYQYACTECGHQLEAVQSFSDQALTECPECAGKLSKVFNSVGIVFKGSGFYRTDSRSGSGSTASTAAKSGEGKSDSAGKSDSSSGTPAPAAAKTESKAAAASTTS